MKFELEFILPVVQRHSYSYAYTYTKILAYTVYESTNTHTSLATTRFYNPRTEL